MAGQDVQQLLLQVDATTELMRRELAKAAAETDQWATRTESAVNRASGSFDAIGGAASFAKGAIGGFIASISIGTLVQAGRAVLDFADSLDAAAEKAGIATERYQTLKEGLRALEVDGEKADSIFQRLQDTLGAVQGGTAAAGVTAALDKMGITSRILNGEITDTAGLFDAIAGSAGKFGSQAEFVASVVDIVGRKLGVDLATALKDGGTALKEQEDQFRDTGAVITDEYVKRLADANEAIDRFAANSKGRLAIWTAETIGFFDQAISAIDRLDKRAEASFLSGIDRMLGVNAPAPKAAPPTDTKARDAATLAQLPKGTAIYNAMATAYAQKYGENPPVAEDAMITVTASKKTSAAPAASRASNRGSRAGGASFSPAQLRAGFGDKIGDLASPGMTIADAGLVSLDAYAVRLDEIRAITVDLSKAQIIDPEQVAIAQKFSADLSRGLGQAIIFGQNLGDALVNSIKAAAAELISSQLLKLLGGESGTGGLLGAVSKGLGSLFGGGRAAGGPVQAGTPYLVGEDRPEIFIPSTRGRIAPRVPAGGGGNNTTDVRVKIEGSELLVATVITAASQAAQGSTNELQRQATRPRLAGGLG